MTFPLLFEAAVMGGTFRPSKPLREAMVGDDVVERGGHPQRHLQLHSQRDGAHSAADFADVLRRGPEPWAMPRPTRPWTSAALTPATRSPFWRPWPLAAPPNFAAAEIEGIGEVELLDIKLAKDLGYRIKLVASAAKTEGRRGREGPSQPDAAGAPSLAQAGGALNALFIEGKRIGRIFIQGPGAGAGPTAAAVAADIADVMTGGPPPGVPGSGHKPAALKHVRGGGSRQVGGQGLSADHGARRAGRHRRHLRGPWPSAACLHRQLSCKSLLKERVGCRLCSLPMPTGRICACPAVDAISRIEKLRAVLERPRLLRVARI
jgi:homoserine dehydrogenase